jgi:DNA helicase II / ATP-dependent DNA helicase PcrA
LSKSTGVIEEPLPGHLQDLNPPQLQAVTHHLGPILILAGAGSGKTRVLTRRVATLVLDHQVFPRQILAITFTNKATEEMRQRLRGLLGPQAEQLWVSTFHSAGLRILRRHAQLLSYTNNFVVYDDQDSKGLLKGVLKEAGIDEKKNSLQAFLRAINRAKNEMLLPEQILGSESGRLSALEAEIYDLYQKALMRADAMDFGDLLLNAVALFQRFPQVLELYRSQIRFLLVDEFQDTNKVQYQLLQLLSEPRRNLFVVGDDDQSIYTFRGATVRNILEFENDYPEAKVVKLEQNYRSTGNILEVAHAIIEKNDARRAKKLWTEAAPGAPIVLYAGWDEGEEAEFIASEIKAELDAGARHAEIAVFYRTNAQSRALEEALMDLSIPYRIYGGLKFYERKEIKDVLAYLRLVANRADNQSFLRALNTPPRGIGAQTISRISRMAAQDAASLWAAAETLREHNKHIQAFMTLIEELSAMAHTADLSELIRVTIIRSGYEERLEDSKDISALSRLENLRELQAIGFGMQRIGEGPLDALQAFLDRVSLTSSDELPDEGQDSPPGGKQKQAKPAAVSLMTLHLAKGLEFPLVFLNGMEEGLLPHYRALQGDGDIDEERRLCYVGITRAMLRLYITRARRRGMFSAGGGFGLSGRFREPSRFIYDVPQAFLENRSGDFFAFETGSEESWDDQGVEDQAWNEEQEGEEPRQGWPKAKKKKRLRPNGAGLVKLADDI